MTTKIKVDLSFTRNLGNYESIKIGIGPHAVGALQSIDAIWEELFPAEQAKVLHTLVERITVRKSGITIKWHDKGLNKLLLDTLEPQKELEAA